MEKKTVALMGCGALGSILAEGVQRRLGDAYTLAGVLCSTPARSRAAGDRFSCKGYQSLEELLAERPDYVAEAATGEAVRACGSAILRGGSDLILLSAGALADETLRGDLEAAARAGGTHLWIASGAIGGFDLMRTMALMGPTDICVDSVKAPASLEGAPFLKGRRLGDAPCRIFDGTVEEAIAGFPKNVTGAGAAALAAAGVEQARARIDSQPGLTADGKYPPDCAAQHVRFGLLGDRLPPGPGESPLQQSGSLERAGPAAGAGIAPSVFLNRRSPQDRLWRPKIQIL